MGNILLINGPNLNLLGTREPQQYGNMDLATVEKQLIKLAKTQGHILSCFQDNAEHKLVEKIHEAGASNIDIIIINPAAFTHTSIALRDALLAIDIPFIEVHLSNVYAREEFRHHSYFSDAAQGVIVGLGAYGYELALQAAFRILQPKP